MKVSASRASRAANPLRSLRSRQAIAAALPLALGLGLSGVLATPARAAEKATVVEILDGNQLFIDQKQAALKQIAFKPQVIATRDSRGQVSFNRDSAARINRFSTLRLGSSCFLLEKGQVLISGPQGGCTRSARLSVRGTNYVMALRPDGSTEVTVLEGTVDVQPLDKDGKPIGSDLVLKPGQRAKVSPAGAIVRLLQLTPGDYRELLGGPLFTEFVSAIPGLNALQNYLEKFLPGVLTGASIYTSKISEVDACNQAQYLIPSKSVVKRFDERVNNSPLGTTFECRVFWSYAFGTPGTNLPQPFPTDIISPLIPNGAL